MRGLRSLLFVLPVLLLLPGCRTADRPAPAAGSPPELRELGRPWPVRIGRFAAPLRLLGHDGTGLIFTTGRSAARYRLDYRRRRLARLPAASPREPEGGRNGIPSGVAASGRTLALSQPEGSLILTDSLLGGAWARTRDGRAVAFYEDSPEGPRLVCHDTAAGGRAVWRRLGMPPARVALAFSADGGYLAEERDGILTVFAREDGSARWSAGGAAPSFGPEGNLLLHRRSDGRLGLLNPAWGYAWPLPVPKGFRRVVSFAWSPDGARVFYLCETAAEAGKAAGRLLCLYEVGTGSWQSHLYAGEADPIAAPAFLRARPAEIGRLAALLPGLAGGTLSFLEEGCYLAGLGRDLVLLHPSVKNAAPKPLHRFPGPVRALSLSGRRLAIVAEEEGEAALYAWRLPAAGALTGIFPDRRDLALGRLRLGMEAAALRAALGIPLETRKMSDPSGGQRILLTHYYPEAAVTVARGRVEQIVYSAAGTATPRGVAIGASRAGVLERYGRPHYELRDYLAYRGEVEGTAIKVAFKFDAGGRVAAILLEREEGRGPAGGTKAAGH